MIALGDAHNFGKFVTLVNSTEIHKPRPIFWEWLFLDSASPLRKYFEPFGIFDAFPNLKFRFDTDDINSCGTVEKVPELKALKSIIDKNAHNIGCTLAICAWFGITDLHSENIVFGMSEEGNFIFAPIDIESALEDMKQLASTLLTYSPRVPRGSSGLSKIYDLAENGCNIAAITAGYFDAFQLLSENQDEILAIINSFTDVDLVHNRIIFRPTREYVQALEKNEFEGFSTGELTQLKRGDVPYFFYPLKEYTFFYSENPHSNLQYQPSIEQMRGLCPPFYQDRKFQRLHSESLLKTGLLQIARTFDSGIREKKFDFDNCKVIVCDRAVTVSIGDLTLQSTRAN